MKSRVALGVAFALYGCSKSDPPVNHTAEVASFFAELRVREEAAKLEHGTYLSTGPDDQHTHPARPSKTPRPITPLPTAWTDLRVVAPQATARCSYVAIAGNGTSPIGPGAQRLGFVGAEANWYYLLAHCLDGDADKYFLTS